MEAQQSDEISLIDLIAVIVRYRRLVLGLPLFVAVAAAVWLYGVPILSGQDSGASAPQVVVERELRFEPVPTRVGEYLGRPPHEVATGLLEDVRVVAPAYSAVEWDDAQMRSFEVGEEPALRSYLRRSFIGERLSHEWSAADRSLLLRVHSTDEAAAREFLRELLRTLSLEFERAMARELSSAIRAADAELRAAEATLRFLQSPDTADGGDLSGFPAALDMLASTTVSREVLSGMQDRVGTLFVPVNDAFVYVDPGAEASRGQSRSVQFVVAVFTAAFLAVFLAFVMNYLRIVRQDSQSMETLSRAWQRK